MYCARYTLIRIAGFINSGRLTAAICLTRPDWCSLSIRASRALTLSFPPALSQWLQPERQIGLCGSFIHIGINLIKKKCTPRGAPKKHKGRLCHECTNNNGQLSTTNFSQHCHPSSNNYHPFFEPQRRYDTGEHKGNAQRPTINQQLLSRQPSSINFSLILFPVFRTFPAP